MISRWRIRNLNNPKIAQIHHVVHKVKQDKEVGVAYMKWADFVRETEEDAREAGMKAGLEEGKKAGMKAGLEEGKKAGLEEGLQEGKEVEIIKLGRKFGKSDAEILALLQEELQITEEQAKQVLEKYGKTLDL